MASPVDSRSIVILKYSSSLRSGAFPQGTGGLLAAAGQGTDLYSDWVLCGLYTPGYSPTLGEPTPECQERASC
jgi:hypothetical protein